MPDKEPVDPRELVYAERQRRDEENFKILLRQLHHDGMSYRIKAAEALGYTGDCRAVEPLIVLLSDPATELVWVTAQSLGRLRDPRAVDPLIPLLQDRDRWVRRGAARALGEIGDSRAVEPLLPLLADRRADVRTAAAEALGRIGEPAALDPLNRLLEDEDEPEVRVAVRQAIRMLGGSVP
jgi:HEAT repeat protein